MSEIIKGGSPQLNNNSTSYTPTLQIKTDANGGGMVLNGTNTTSNIDCTNNKLQINYTHTTNGSSTWIMASNRVDFNDKVYITSTDAQYQIRSIPYSSSYANIFIDNDGGNINLGNVGGTCKVTINMNNGDAVWKREWTSGTSYAREIRISDSGITLTGPLTINGKLTGNNVQIPGEVRMFDSNDFITGHPTNRYGVIMGTAEIDQNAMVLRIKAYITERTSGSSQGAWSSSSTNFFTPAQILTACGLASTYKFDVSRLTGGINKSTADTPFTGFTIGIAQWNYTTGANVYDHQRRGAFILFRQVHTGDSAANDYCTINRSTNGDGAGDFAGSGYDRAVPQVELFYDNGLTVEFTLPITTV